MNAATATLAARSFHEWPLVVFTTLAVGGAGLLTAPLLSLAAPGPRAPAALAVRWGVALLAIGLAVSLAHLGKPLRAPLTAAGLGRSRLSAEVLAAGLATLAGAAAALLPSVSPALDVAAGICAVAFLVTLGLVYALPGQQTWGGVVAWMPLTTGLGLGAVSLAASRGEALAVGAVPIVVLAADAALLVVRRTSLVRRSATLLPRYPAAFEHAQALLFARLVLVDTLPGACLLAGFRRTGVALFALGLLADRLAFYGLAAQRTTESELARVEGIIASGV